ncbi:MAG: nucleotidyltransferase domain-containing protein [Anaerohalosphaeraceae bacterium]
MVTIIRQHLEELVCLCRRYRVKRLELFGSAGTENGFQPDRSDLDFLVAFQPMSPREHAKAYFGLLAQMQDLFGCPIDLVEIEAVRNPYFLEQVNRSKQEIYAA